MADNKNMLVRANLKQLKLPAMGAEFEKLAREAAEANEGYEQYLLRLTELEVAARASNAVQARTRAAGFPVAKDFDTFDFFGGPRTWHRRISGRALREVGLAGLVGGLRGALGIVIDLGERLLRIHRRQLSGRLRFNQYLASRR